MSKIFIIFPEENRAFSGDSEIPVDYVSDGYHTFGELYQHRHYLFIALMHAYSDISWKAKKHSDGSMYDRWFIAGMDLPSGQITYHLPLWMWDAVKVKELDKAPPYDGHTSVNVLTRLGEFITLHQKPVKEVKNGYSI